MQSFNYRLLAVISICTLITACCGSPIKVTSSCDPKTAGYCSIRVVQQPLPEQFLSATPNYLITLPENMVLQKGTISVKNKQIGIPVLRSGQYKYIFIDLTGQKIVWDMDLPKKTVLYGSGFTHSGDLFLDVRYHGNTTLFLSCKEGKEIWRYGKGTELENYTPFKIFTQDDFYYVFGGEKIFTVDPDTFQILHTADRFETELDNLTLVRSSGFSKPPLFSTRIYTFDDQTVMTDNGLYTVSNQTGEIETSTRFPTYACRFHTGKNIAGCLMASCIAGCTGVAAPYHARRPDYVYQKTLFERTDQYYVVSAMNVVYCIDRSSGDIRWATDIGMAYANLVHVADNQVYIAAFGNQGNGLVCLSLDDGSRVKSFKSPFTGQVEVEQLTPDVLSELTEKHIWGRDNECYINLITKKKCLTPGAPQIELKKVIPIKDSLVALTENSIYVVENKTGTVSKYLTMSELKTRRIEDIYKLKDDQIIGVTKGEILSLNLQEGKYDWKVELDWYVDDVSKVHRSTIGDKYIFVYTWINKKMNGYVIDRDTGMISARLDSDELLVNNDAIALRKGNTVEIYIDEYTQHAHNAGDSS